MLKYLSSSSRWGRGEGRDCCWVKGGKHTQKMPKRVAKVSFRGQRKKWPKGTHNTHTHMCHTPTHTHRQTERAAVEATICLLCLWHVGRTAETFCCLLLLLLLLRFVFQLLPYPHSFRLRCCCCFRHQYLAPTISATPTQRVYITSNSIYTHTHTHITSTHMFI